ncbi:MAG TPA: hypothetical protein VHL58_14705, partial [Thermoanaerobaculia bacterium]|nr:hypothetical protein [Thermoanaerobaculia bacterium]
LAGPSLRQSWIARVGGKGWRTVDLDAIVEEGIDLVTRNYAPDDALCCPSVDGSAAFYLIDDELQETEALIDCDSGGGDEPEIGRPDGNGTLTSTGKGVTPALRRHLRPSRHSV